MGQKDISEKILEAYNDVFSDIVNVLLFNGETVIRPDELEEQIPKNAYKVDGKYREIERDVAKRWKNGNIRVACIGLENQTNPDADMPLRIMGYDGAEYRSQLNTEQGDRYPVITLVLYFGHKKHWDKPLSLLERLNVPEKFIPFINDYKVNLFEIAFLSKEQVNLFNSDFKVVADYFVQMQETGNYIPNAEELKHVQETLSLLSIMSDDNRFESVINEDMANNGKGISNMCEVLDRIEARGKLTATIEVAKKMIARGKLSLEEIAEDSGLTIETVKELASGKIS